MEEKDKDKKASQSDLEKEQNERIRKQSPDLTELVFDLFFDNEFKGNVDPSSDEEKKKSHQNK